MLLAGLVLKIRIIFCSLFASSILIFTAGLAVAVFMINNADAKVVMAYSSVFHITLCAFLMGFMRFVVRMTHVIISPLIFVIVYVSYLSARSRLLAPSFISYRVGAVLLINLRFPIFGSFISEVYLVSLLGRCPITYFMMSFFFARIVHMKIFYCMKRSVNTDVLGWIVILLLVY
jgi:hypothetical protein